LIPELARTADRFSDETDTSASGTSKGNGQPILLREHLPGVESLARRYAIGCGLPQELADAVALAGLLHDLGKADPRFQALLRGGNRWTTGELLAKSAGMPKSRSSYLTACTASGYPQGSRHELLSVRLAESASNLLPKNADMRDLVLHLIASHHGHCRPFAPVVFDEDPTAVSIVMNDETLSWEKATGLERIDSGVAERFWRLVRTYGWWGLAWLEALLRLADHRRSEGEETQ